MNNIMACAENIADVLKYSRCTFYKGNYELVQNKCVGFTGSRKVSDSGIKITDSSARQLFVVEYGVSKSTAEGNTFFLQHGGMPLRGDKNGKPILKRVYSALEQNELEKNYEQISFNLG